MGDGAVRYHGDQELAPGLVDLAVNVRDAPMPSWLRAALLRSLDDLARYPDQADARKRLGFLRYEDRWLTQDEYYAARGFVKVGGEWISADEARRRDVARKDAEALKKHVRTIRDSIAKMSSMKRKTRNEGKLELQKYADEREDLKLGAFASDVEQFYNAQWRAIREELVLVQVSTTNATLKRPIPTFTTSLGAFSTPVTIQLPELSVVSVKTTVLVPADIELDEDP